MAQQLVAAFALAACVGLSVAFLSGLIFEPFAVVGGWGAINGLTAAVAAFLTMLGRGRRWPAAVARWLLVVLVGLVAYGLVWWSLATRTPLWSLEGAWLWPFSVAALGAWVAAARWAWRSPR